MLPLDDKGAMDHQLQPGDVDELAAVVVLPREERLLALKRIAAREGSERILEIFADFIGLANSVYESNRRWFEEYLVLECGWADRQAEQINLSTVFGALMGVKLAILPVPGMCHGCAFRAGSPANQSPVTTADVNWLLGNDDPFYCHETLDDKGQPRKVCAGFAAVKKASEEIEANVGSTR